MYRNNSWWAETVKWPHTRTLHKTDQEIRGMKQWLREHLNNDYRVQTRATRRGAHTGLQSVVVYANTKDEDFWTLFKLVWM